MLELTKYGEKGILGVSYDNGNAAFAQKWIIAGVTKEAIKQ